MLKLLRYAILVLNVANWLFGLAWLALIVSGIYQAGIDLSEGRGEFILQSLLNIAVVGLVHVIFSSLIRMMADTERGNAWGALATRRLYMIGWALLGVAVLSARPVATGAELTGAEFIVWNALWRLTGDAELIGSVRPSLTIWLVVPLVFVLATIFRDGARMKADLEGTV